MNGERGKNRGEMVCGELAVVWRDEVAKEQSEIVNLSVQNVGDALNRNGEIGQRLC